MNIIEIKDLTHRFSNGEVGLNRIDLRVKAGEFVVICGPNGSGKTTLLRHLNGLLMPESGSVNISGLDVSENAAKVRQLVGMVFQDADSQIVGETVFADVTHFRCIESHATGGTAIDATDPQRSAIGHGDGRRRSTATKRSAQNNIVRRDE